MPSDDESDSKASKLETREQFPGWKERMGLLAMEKAGEIPSSTCHDWGGFPPELVTIVILGLVGA